VVVNLLSQDIIGVIKSGNLKYESDFGFSLAIMSTKIIGAEASSSEQPYAVFLDPNSTVEVSKYQNADEIVKDIEGKKCFELYKDSILKIVINVPSEDGMDGTLTFTTKDKDVQLILKKILTKHPGLTDEEAKVLVMSLLVFAPDRLYTIEDDLVSEIGKPTSPVEVQEPDDPSIPIYTVHRDEGLWTYHFYWDHFTKTRLGGTPLDIPLTDIETVELNLNVQLNARGPPLTTESLIFKIKGENQAFTLSNPLDEAGKAYLFEWLSARNVKTIDEEPDYSPSARLRRLMESRKQTSVFPEQENNTIIADQTNNAYSEKPFEDEAKAVYPDIPSIQKRFYSILGDKYKLEVTYDGSIFTGFRVKAKTGIFSSKDIAQIEYSPGLTSNWNITCLDSEFILIADKLRAELSTIEPS